MIQELTEEQKASFPEFVEKWKTIGLSCDDTDKPKAIAAINQAYKCAGLDAPKSFVFCDGPLSGAITASLLHSVSDSVWDSVRDSVSDSVSDSVRDSVSDSVSDSVRASVRASVWDSVRDSVSDSVRDSVSDSVSDSVRASVRASVWDSVRDSVSDSVWDSVRDSVWDSVWDSVRDSVRDSMNAMVFGAHEASWLSFYDFFSENSLVNLEKLSGLVSAAKECGWWSPYKEIAIVQHRHCELNRNDKGQLHATDKMAVKYRDGWGVYALNGVRMEPWMIEEEFNAKKVVTVENVEQRRELIRLHGIERLLSELPSKTLDTQGDYSLISVDLSNEIKGALYLKMLNPSIGTWHMEGVAPGCTTVEKAINWRAGDVDKAWQPAVLT